MNIETPPKANTGILWMGSELKDQTKLEWGKRAHCRDLSDIHGAVCTLNPNTALGPAAVEVITEGRRDVLKGQRVGTCQEKKNLEVISWLRFRCSGHKRVLQGMPELFGSPSSPCNLMKVLLVINTNFIDQKTARESNSLGCKGFLEDSDATCHVK